MRIANLTFITGVVGILASSVTARADARYVEMPKELPATVDLRVADGCTARSETLSLLSELAETAKGHAAQGDVPIRVAGPREHPVVVFGRPPKGHEPSLKTMVECLTIYAGSPQMLTHLGLYVQDDAVPTGWFAYDPRIGIYADPRTVTLFPSAK